MDSKTSKLIFEQYRWVHQLSPADTQKLFQRFALECDGIDELLGGLLLDRQIGNVWHSHALGKLFTDFLIKEYMENYDMYGEESDWDGEIITAASGDIGLAIGGSE